jgi:hypothetical protein
MKKSFKDCKTKTERVAYIRAALSTDYGWASKGLLRIYDNQTADEKAVQETRVWNNIGFTGADANLLSSFAEQIRSGRSMSPKQVGLIFKKMPKYAKQLESVSAR